MDIDKKFEPTIIADVRDIDPPNTWKAGEFDVVWCSPPCTFFSIARSRAPRDFRSADQIVLACWDIIRHLISDTTKNVFWFMENPATGYLKTRPYMQEYADDKKTLCYCKYGCPYKKSTNIWSNMDWEPTAHVQQMVSLPKLCRQPSSPNCTKGSKQTQNRNDSRRRF